MNEFSWFKPDLLGVSKKDYWQLEAEAPCQRRVEVILDSSVDQKIKAMTEEMGYLEWLGYLLGSIETEPPRIVIDDIFIPEQQVSPSSIKVTEKVVLSNIVGTVHSHGSVASSQSSVDKEFLAANHPVCLITGRDGKYVCSARLLMPCGRWTTVPSTLIIKNSREASDFAKKMAVKCRKQETALPEQLALPANKGTIELKSCPVCGLSFSYQSDSSQLCSGCQASLKYYGVLVYEEANKFYALLENGTLWEIPAYLYSLYYGDTIIEDEAFIELVKKHGKKVGKLGKKSEKH